jgi:hypothetical protein
MGFRIGTSADSAPLIRPIRFFATFSNFRRPEGQNFPDIDQIVGDHAPIRPIVSCHRRRDSDTDSSHDGV